MKTKQNKASHILLSISALGLLLVGCTAKDSAGADNQNTVEASKSSVSSSTSSVKSKSSDAASAVEAQNKAALDAMQKQFDAIKKENEDLKSQAANAQSSAKNDTSLSDAEKFQTEQETARFNKILEFMMMSKIFGPQAKLLGAISEDISADANKDSEKDPCIEAAATSDAGYSFDEDISKALELARGSFNRPTNTTSDQPDVVEGSSPDPVEQDASQSQMGAIEPTKNSWQKMAAAFKDWVAKGQQASTQSAVNPVPGEQTGGRLAGEQTGGRENIDPTLPKPNSSTDEG